jgi:zinc transporter ZupT
VKSTCSKITGIQACVGIALFFGAAYAFPALLCFLGSRTEVTRSFPQWCALYLAGGAALSLCIATGLALSSSVPGASLSGIGMICTVSAMLCFLGSAGLASLAKAMLDAEAEEEEKRASMPAVVREVHRADSPRGGTAGYAEGKSTKPALAWAEEGECPDQRLARLAVAAATNANAWAPPPDMSPPSLTLSNEGDVKPTGRPLFNARLVNSLTLPQR